MVRPDRGVTLLINVGPWCRPYLHLGRRWWRVCLGWMAISLYAADMDPILADWADRTDAGRRAAHTG